MSRLLVIQHAPHSGLGAYGEVLDELGDDLEWLRLQEGGRLPPTAEGFDGVISLGAEISVYDGERDWLEPELALLRGAIAAGTPAWGICFGAQMLAAAAGARVWKGDVPEVGIHPLRLTAAAAADPVFGGLPATVPVFHWHGDSFDLPPEATLLAGSEAYPHQAFRVGAHAYGVQFHAEATSDLVARWIDFPATAEQLEAANGAGAARRVLAEAERGLPEANDVARELMRGWRAVFGG
jgi:GMP synthase-like glutamine amidotransferase